MIGNPPYLRVQGLRESHADETKFMETRYKVATGRFDFYVLFLEKGFSLLKDDGILSFILPHKFINSDFGVGTRKFIYENKALKFLVHFGATQVFEKASVYTCIIGLSKNNESFDFAQVEPLSIEDGVSFEKIPIEKLKDCERWSFQNSEKGNLIDKLREQPLKLKDITEICSQGTVSMGDDIYMMQGRFEGDYFIGYSEQIKQEVKLEKEIMIPILKGEDVKRYAPSQNSWWEIYPHHLDGNGKTIPYTEKEMKGKFPLVYEYLLPFKKELKEKKIRYKTNPEFWYALHRSREISMFTQPKIITAEISLGCNMTYDTNKIYHNTKVYSIIFSKKYSEFTKAYFAILNSPVMWFFLSQTGYALRGGFFTFKTKYLEPFPLPDLTNSQFSTVNYQLTSDSQLSTFVDQMLATKAQLAGKISDADKKLLEQRCEILDKNINTIVYQLYGLTDKEIAIVEGK